MTGCPSCELVVQKLLQFLDLTTEDNKDPRCDANSLWLGCGRDTKRGFAERSDIKCIASCVWKAPKGVLAPESSA